MTLKEKLINCYKILFKNKPISTITYGVKVIRCDECEYNMKCEECLYKELAKVRFNKE